MGICLNWFKTYKIIIQDGAGFLSQPYCSEIVLTGGDNTSHGYGSAADLRKLFMNVTELEFPSICEYSIHSEDDDIGLIEPAEMIKYCDMMLATKEVDELDLRDRVEWFKELSEQGYYIAYDYE